MQNKIKISATEFDEKYEIEESPIPEIIPEIKSEPAFSREHSKLKESFLTEEEQEHEKELYDTLEMPEEDK